MPSTAITPAVTLSTDRSIRPAGIELLVGGHQRAGLFLQAPRHSVERRAKRGDFIVGWANDWNAGAKIALLDPPGSIDQLFDRPEQTIGELQSGENGQGDNDQRACQKRTVEFELIAAATLEQSTVIGQDSSRRSICCRKIIASLDATRINLPGSSPSGVIGPQCACVTTSAAWVCL